MPSPAIGMLSEQAMRVLPHQVIFAGLLELSGYELHDAIERELAENPALVGDSPEPPTVPLLPPSAQSVAAAGDLPDAKEPPVAALLADVAADLPSADRWLAEYLLADLDERGLLGRSLATIASELQVPLARMARVLAAVRQAGPPGIAAIDIRECLRLQLADLSARGVAVPSHLHAVLEQPWELIAEPTRCAVAAGIPPAAVEQALGFLRQHCRPYAFLPDCAGIPATMPVPDLVVIEGADGELDVVAADPGASLRIDRQYLEAIRGDQLPQAQAAELHAQVSRARAFIAYLQQRTGTVVTVARAAVRRQAAFVRHGPRAHAPLTRTELAAELGLSEPTVSRAVSGKSLRLPDGTIVTMAALFGTSVSVREALSELLRGDPPARSDGELAALLSVAGFKVARRTVAKYRRQIGVASPGRR